MSEPVEQSLRLDTKQLTDRLQRHPYAVVAGAIGVGYVLGGGLFTRLTARIVNAALRVGVSAALPQLSEELLHFATREVLGTDAPAEKSRAKKRP